MKNRFSFVLFIIGVFLLWGCYPQGPDYVEELDVVITYHNPDYAFGSQATFAMPDKIVKITGNLEEGEEPEFIPDATGVPILKMIEDNMTSLGYQLVDIDAAPDLLLVPSSWETTTISYWYDYWYWWWGGYYPNWGWGGYYPYYPPVYVSSYTTGTLLMTLHDKNELSANGNPLVLWTGSISGVLTGSYNATRVNTGIDKAFDQSPYLKTN